MKKFSVLDKIAFALVIIGGLNWGLVGLFRFDLVAAIFGDAFIARAVYVIVLAATVYFVAILPKLAKK